MAVFPLLQAVANGGIRILPERFEKVRLCEAV